MIELQSFITFLNALPDPILYLVLGASAFFENAFPPLPGDTITAFGAFLVGTDRINFMGVYLGTLFGSTLGFLSLFLLGRLLGKHFFIRRDYRFFKAADIDRAERWFHRYGYTIILFNRFFPGIRGVVSIAAGASGLRLPKVALLALVSSALWNLIWVGIGFTLGDNWEVVSDRLAAVMMRYNLLVFALLGLVILVVVAVKLLRKYGLLPRRSPRQSSPEKAGTLPKS